jgi:hypothetical protein
VRKQIKRENNRSAFAESTGVLLVHDPLAYIAMHPFENESKLTLAQKKKKSIWCVPLATQRIETEGLS